MEEAAFRAAAQGFAAQGYDLVCGNAVSFGGKDFYTALWQKKAAASVMHHGMTGAFQRACQEASKRAVVFGQQNTRHAGSSP